jgi:hypothetical protein
LAQESELNALARARIGVLGALSEVHLAMQLLIISSPVSGRAPQDRATAADAAAASLKRYDELVEVARSAMAAAHDAHDAARRQLAAGGGGSGAAASGSSGGGARGARGRGGASASGGSGIAGGSDAQMQDTAGQPAAGGADAAAPAPGPFGCCLPASALARRCVGPTGLLPAITLSSRRPICSLDPPHPISRAHNLTAHPPPLAVTLPSTQNHTTASLTASITR